LEQGGVRVGGNVLRRLEHAKCARALGVGLALGNLLAVEVRHLLKEMNVVQQDRAIGADRQRVAVARRRCAGAHRRPGHAIASRHDQSPALPGQRPSRPCDSSTIRGSSLASIQTYNNPVSVMELRPSDVRGWDMASADLTKILL